jgi:hypothetical protein
MSVPNAREMPEALARFFEERSGGVEKSERPRERPDGGI